MVGNYGGNQKSKKSCCKFGKHGFTLIELLVVIAIVGFLTSVVITSVTAARNKARKVAAVANIKQMQKALEMYISDVGFYPPDVNRGWDPGLSKPLPYNLLNPTQDCNTNISSCVCNNYLSCTDSNPYPSYLPSDWLTQVQSKWRGPYVAKWPSSTPWGGVYDYNYWNINTDRGPCGANPTWMVAPGIYLGIESGIGWTFDANIEQQLYNEGIDNDGCGINGESQLMMIKF